jgi:hypothetical protein
MKDGVPSGIRTRVAAVRGQCPGPLDDGDFRIAGNLSEGLSRIKHKFWYYNVIY